METLKILLGEDFWPGEDMTFRKLYLSQLEQALSQYTITCDIEQTAKRVIAKAGQGYDIVVTDLDYSGDGRGKEGFDVVDAVSQLTPKPLLILCTSSDAYKEIEKRTKGKVDYVTGKCEGITHKFGKLVEILTEHYKQK